MPYFLSSPLPWSWLLILHAIRNSSICTLSTAPIVVAAHTSANANEIPSSLASKSILASALTPPAPIDLTLLSKTTNSVQLAWVSGASNENEGDKDSNISNDGSASSTSTSRTITEPAHLYHLQYRRQIRSSAPRSTVLVSIEEEEKSNPLKWIDHSPPLSAMVKLPLPEIQEVTTLIDDDDDGGDEDNGENSSITSGFIWFKLEIPQPGNHNHNSKPYNPHESTSISHPVPHNATAHEFEQALMNISGINHNHQIRVFRYQPGQYGSSIQSHRGTYAWRIEFDNSITSAPGGSLPLLQIYKDTLDGHFLGSNGLSSSSSGGTRSKRVAIRRILKGTPALYDSDGKHELYVDGLDDETIYQFRIRGENSHGFGSWSQILRNIKTDVLLPSRDKIYLEHLDGYDANDAHHDNNYVKKIMGSGRMSGNKNDPDYIAGAGMGGMPLQNGRDGVVVILSYSDGKNNNNAGGLIIPSRTYFYHTGMVQYFQVQDNAANYIDVKMWASGTSGGGTNSTVPDFRARDGIGGAFIQSRVNVHPGEMLQIMVGNGGKINLLDQKPAYDGKGAPVSIFNPHMNYSLANGQIAVNADASIQYGGDCKLSRKNGKLLVLAGKTSENFAAFQDNDDDDGKFHEYELPSPVILNVTHNALAYVWGLKAQVHSFFQSNHDLGTIAVEISSGRKGVAEEVDHAGIDTGEGFHQYHHQCSDDFKTVDFVPNGQYTQIYSNSVEDLIPSTCYCIRVVGNGFKSPIATIFTLEEPKNIWRNIHSRNLNNFSSNESEGMMATKSCPILIEPNARRGHSMSFANDKVYMFGGKTKACTCSNEKCRDTNVYSNELWELDPLTNIWTLLLEHSPFAFESNAPIGREGHSATVLANGKIIVIGGTSKDTTSDQPIILGDVWELDPGLETSHSFTSNNTNQKLVDGKISYNEIEVKISPSEDDRPGSLCVKDISVEVEMKHACIEQLGSISLYGPSNTKLSMKYNGDDTQLFVGTTWKHQSCTERNATVSISYDAHRSILEYNALPKSGSYIPAEGIQHSFTNKPVDGLWSLAIRDDRKDGITGNLLNWTLNLDVKYCDSGVRWKKLRTNSCDSSTVLDGHMHIHECPKNDEEGPPRNVFTPRHQHSAIAVGDDVFVLGGYAHGIVQETWRLDYAKNTFVRLHDGTYRRRRRWNGQSAVLIPHGVVAYGGLGIDDSGSGFEEGLYHYDVWTQKRQKLQSHSVGQSSENSKPQGRYLNGMCFVGKSHLIFDSRKVQDWGSIRSQLDPALLMFSGDGHLLHETYLGDKWVLTIGMEHSHNGTCDSLLNPSRTANNLWDWSCGALADENSENECRFESIVQMAWCHQQYNSFASIF